MATVSDDLVERVALAIVEANNYGERAPSWRERSAARAAIEALSTPEFVLPLAEAMLRGKNVYVVELQTAAVALRDQRDELLELEDTLLDSYREAKGA